METARKRAFRGLQRWHPPLPATKYGRGYELTVDERKSILSFLRSRSNPSRRKSQHSLPEQHSLQRLLQPLHDALDIVGSKPTNRAWTIAVLLRECLDADSTFWTWSHDEWVAVIGRTALAFRARNRLRSAQCARLEIAAISFIHGWFRDVLALGHFQRITLARYVFGVDAVETASSQVTEPLNQWGYTVGTPLLSCLCEALLLNESPHLEHLTAETLDCFRRGAPKVKRALYFQIAKALAFRGILDEPLPVARPLQYAGQVDVSVGVAPEWSGWVERWTRTSTLESRGKIRLNLYKAGRWLVAHHPEIVSPAQWTRKLAAEYVAAVTRMRVGDYTARKAAHPRDGQPLAPRSISAELVAVRTFILNCQEWGWIPRRFDPSRSLALPRNIKALIGTEPQVIDDDVWARLLWAGLHLQEDDLPRVGRNGVLGHTYPLEYIRALALVWLFAGLRSDEISRLRVDCVRWQPVVDGAANESVCLLDVPVNKTKTCFTKPVDPHVGQAIETWKTVRPVQPMNTDRKTGESVDMLFAYQARPMRREFINRSIIPTLCRKAGVETRDARGAITSHRARATIASQLFNSREPMSLFELQAWLGHGSPASTQHYVAITPTKLAKAYTDAGYFERNVRAIEVLIDQDSVKQAVVEGEPWRYYDLGHGLCAYEFFDQCAHRLACARCDFYRPKRSALVQLLEAKENILRFLQQIPLTDEESSVVDGDLAAIERLAAKLVDQPTPSGQTPSELGHCPCRP